jgi:hypothetical protein
LDLDLVVDLDFDLDFVLDLDLDLDRASRCRGPRPGMVVAVGS